MKDSIIYTIGGFILLVFIITVLNVTVCAPAGILNKTFQSDNIIYNYEWFHDTYRAYQRRLSDIQGHKELLIDENNSKESERLRMEYVAMKMSCRTLVAEYNANSSKVNREIFKGTSVPNRLLMESCND